MKQWISLMILMLVIGSAPLNAQAAGSATFTLSKENVAVESGESFDLEVGINLSGESVDTARVVLTFDPSVVRAQSVVLNGAYNRSAPGNFIDNKSGKVYWGGFTLDDSVPENSSFAKVTFQSQKEGNATIGVSSDSKLISDGEEKMNSGKLGKTRVSVSKASAPVEGLSILTVNSSSHINDFDWYSNNNVEVSWTSAGGNSAVKEYFYSFDQSSSTDPSTRLDGSETKTSFKDVKDGIHYFHIKAVQEDGKETKTVHRKVKVDVSAPNAFEATFADKQILENESVYAIFATTDDASGVKGYKMSINDSEFQPQQSPLEIEDLDPGTYFIRVAAVDRAGNVRLYGKSVRVYPNETDLNRPEGYDAKAEIEAVNNRGDQEQKEDSSTGTVAVIFLVILLLIGVFYTTYLRKKRELN